MTEPKVAHGASRRADIEGVACCHQYDAQTVELVWNRHGCLFEDATVGAGVHARDAGGSRECACLQQFTGCTDFSASPHAVPAPTELSAQSDRNTIHPKQSTAWDTC